MWYEFTVVAENLQNAYKNNFKNLQPLSPGNVGYSMLRHGTASDFYQSLITMCETMNLPLEGVHTEIGPGVLEAAIAYGRALESADKAALFKTMTKTLAQKQNMMATFMAKYSADQQGHSGHTHISLRI